MNLKEHLQIALKIRRKELAEEIKVDTDPLVQRHKLGQEFALKFVENEIRIWERNQYEHE